MLSAAAVALLMPSMAEETIPPEYPAPSPHGRSPGKERDSRVCGSRGMRIGDEVLDSTPTRIASLV